MTTASRTASYDGAYAPFGENYAGSGTTDLNFTGQVQDTVSGLYDFLFRGYSPAQGRWVSPDPVGLGAVNPANPQTWNRYAYVTDNPLNAIDPLGLRNWDRMDALGSGSNCFGDPNCASYYVNGVQVPSTIALAYLSMGNGAQGNLQLILTTQYSNVSSATGTYDPKTDRFTPNESDEGTDSAYIDATVTA